MQRSAGATQYRAGVRWTPLSSVARGANGRVGDRNRRRGGENCAL